MSRRRSLSPEVKPLIKALGLVKGVRYQAARPLASRGRHEFPVTFTPIDGSTAPVRVIDGLDYDQANQVLAEFNNGRTSFEGRVWKG